MASSAQEIKFVGELSKKSKFPWVVIGGCFAGMVGYGMLHTYWIDKYQSWMQMYYRGKPRKLDDKLQLMAWQTLDEMKIPMKFKQKTSEKFREASVRFFPVIGGDVWSAGSTNFVRGAIIGIPYCFTYESTDDIDTSEVIVGSNSPRSKERKFVSWETDAAKDLLEAFVLSEQAKKFAIAREIHVTSSHKRLVLCLVPPAFVVCTYLLGALIAHRNKISKRMLPVRMTVYSIYTALLLAVTYGMYRSILEHYDRQADKRAIGTNFEYYQPAAIAYYEQLLKRNRALRELYPEKFGSLLTPQGDPVAPWNNSLPLTERVEIIKAMKPEHVVY